MCRIGAFRRSSYDIFPAVTDVFLSRFRRAELTQRGGVDVTMMELQQLLLSRDYLVPVPGHVHARAAGYLQASGDDTPVDDGADRTTGSTSGLTASVDCHRSSLHDVLWLRHQQRQHNPVTAVMQYPASQHPLPAAAAAAAAVGLAAGPAGSSPYCGPSYYQRCSSATQHYLTHGFSDSSRHNLESLATRMQPGFSYEQHAALLRDTATRLAVSDNVDLAAASRLNAPSRLDPSPASRLGVYCSDRRCTGTDCLAPTAVPTLDLPSSRYYRTEGGHVQMNASAMCRPGVSGTPGPASDFMWYLRPPVSTGGSYCSTDCVCQWLDSCSITGKHKVSELAHTMTLTLTLHI